MKGLSRFSLLVTGGLLFLMSLAACGQAARSSPLPSADFTHIYQTLAVRLTQTAQAGALPTPSANPAATPSSTAAALPSPSLLPPAATSSPAAATLPLTPTPTQVCDRAAPGLPKIDVTIDDDTLMRSGEMFTKVWRLANVGICTWGKDYAAVWFSGEKFGETLVVPLNTLVPPGQSVEISIDMTAPLMPGTYQSNWKLRNAGGVLFGIGPNGNAPFWVRIIVIEQATSTPVPSFTPTATLSPSAAPTATDTPSATLTPSATPTVTDTPTATLSPSATATATATPAVQAWGQVTLSPGNSFDLDTGQANSAADDFAYQADAGNHLLMPQAGAVFGIYINRERPAPENCRLAAMSAFPLPMESLPIGTYLCYRTSQGLLGWLQLDGFDAGASLVTFSFVTWGE